MDEARLFSVMCSNRTKSNGLKYEHRKFCTNMSKNFFMVRGDGALKQVARRDFGVSFYRDIQDLAGCLPV